MRLLRTFGWLVAATLGFWQTAQAQYCLPTYNNQCTSGDYIDAVTFVTINNLGTGCTAPSASNYTNYSATIGTTVTAGVSNTITVAPGPTWGQYFVALIDLNMDNDFSDAGEFFDIGYALGGGTVSAPITIPCGAMPGTTRLRILCRYANTPIVPADICAPSLSFGEIEDYALTITLPSYIDAGAGTFTSPTTSCGLGAAVPVTMTAYNCGGFTITSLQLCYSLNGGPNICETATVSLAPGGTYTHTFASTVNLSATGNYTLSGTVTVAGDVVPSNDNLTGVVVTNIPIVSTLPYSQNFDGGNGGFTTNGPNSSWQWGAPTGTFINAASSAPNAWVTNLAGTFNPNEMSYLVSPCFNFTSLAADPFLSFSHIYDLIGFGDAGWVEVSTNGGTTWTKLGTAATGNNWYDDAFSDTWVNNSGAAGQWRTADHRLTGTAGSGNVRFRYAFQSDAFNEFEGFGVDNIRIKDTVFNLGVTAINSPLNGCALGTTETVSVEIVNYGTHTINNFPVCFRIDGLPAVCETVTTAIPAGDTLIYTFTGTANLSVVGAHTVLSYTDHLRDSIFDNDSSDVIAVNYPVISASPVYFQDFEAGQGNWSAAGRNSDWAYGTPFKAVIQGAASGTKAWVTGTTGFFNYASDQDSWVESPCFDMTALTNPWVGAKIWWNSEDGWDATLLEYSTDGGNVWNQVGQFADPHFWYNDDDFIAVTSAGLEGDGWGGTGSSSSAGYVQAKHDISMLAGAPEVRFRMHFLSDFSVEYDGMAFDDFVLANPPTVNLGNDTIVCTTYTINPGIVGGDFQWSNNDTTPTITVTTSGTYHLTYTDSYGLCAMDTVEVTINPTPAVNLGPAQNICAGSTICISVDTVAYPTVTWSTGATTGQICVNTSGSFGVQVIDTVGCASGSNIVTTVVPLPTPQLGPDTVLCQGSLLCLDPQVSPSGNTFIWSNGASSPTICVSIISGYWVSVTDANGCSKADSIIVTAGPQAPVASATFDTTGCPVVTFNSTASGTVSGYSWSFGDGGSASAASPSHDYTAGGNGSYTVTHIVQNACGADTTTFTLTISCLVSIDGGVGTHFSLWPNPNQGQFRISTTVPGDQPASVEIVNMHGQTVFVRDYGMETGTFLEDITLDAHATGIYFVRFKVGEQIRTEKLVVE